MSERNKAKSEALDKTHLYSKSEIHNIKWFLKRIIQHKKNSVDKAISFYLEKIVKNNNAFDFGLNIGCGFYTPYDFLIRKISRKTINIDTSLTVRLARPFSTKRIRLIESNWKDVLELYNPQVIFCFHSFTFIQINWIEFIEYCDKNNIKFCFDWSLQNSKDAEIGTNRFCVGNGVKELEQTLLHYGYKFFDVLDAEQSVSDVAIGSGKRFIVSNL